MRSKLEAALLAPALLLACKAHPRAEQMIGAPPVREGLMCRDKKSLADLTAQDGGPKVDFEHPNSQAGKGYFANCQHVLGGEEVTVIARRRQTSIVTYQGQTWYVPNIDLMTPTPDCIKPETKVSLAGRAEQGFARTDEVDPRKGYRYARLALDEPICFLGNQARNVDRYVSLMDASSKAGAA